MTKGEKALKFLQLVARDTSRARPRGKVEIARGDDGLIYITVGGFLRYVMDRRTYNRYRRAAAAGRLPRIRTVEWLKKPSR